MKTVKMGDWLRYGLYVGVLCQTDFNVVSFIIMKPTLANRWNEGYKVVNRENISIDELKHILNRDIFDEFEIRVGKRYVNLEKYLKT